MKVPSAVPKRRRTSSGEAVLAAARIVFAALLAFFASWGSATPARADDNAGGASDTPFIDRIKKEMPDSGQPAENPGELDPYIQSQLKKMAPEKDDGSFIDKVKQENPTYFDKDPDGNYLDRKKEELGPAPEGGAIQAVKDGNSELHARKVGEPSSAFGFELTTLINPSITAGDSLQNFTTVYPKWIPDFALTYEKRLLRFWSGEISLNGSFGGTYNKGQGIFKNQLTNYTASPTFTYPATSSTNFQFMTVPISVGLDYRMSGLKYIQPYASIAPELIPFVEFRDDGGRTHYGDSRCIVSELGVWLQLDWLSKAASWDLYNDYGIQHFYLAILYQNVFTFSGGVDFALNGVTTGLTFEF